MFKVQQIGTTLKDYKLKEIMQVGQHGFYQYCLLLIAIFHQTIFHMKLQSQNAPNEIVPLISINIFILIAIRSLWLFIQLNYIVFNLNVFTDKIILVNQYTIFIFISMKKNNINQDIHCVFEGIGGNGNIYISGIKAATDKNTIKSLNIRAIISATLTSNIDKKLLELDHYIHIPALDCQQFKISDYFQKTYDFIQQARKTTNVLVHCQAGISRSSTIVLAYLMKKYKYSSNELLALLKRKRKQINPNRGFIQQLQKYEQKLKLQKKKQFKTVISSILRQSRQKASKRSQSVPLSFRKRQDNNVQRQQTNPEASKDIINNRSNFLGEKHQFSRQNPQVKNQPHPQRYQERSQKNQIYSRYHSSFIVCKSIDVKQKYVRLKKEQNAKLPEKQTSPKIDSNIKKTSASKDICASNECKDQQKIGQLLQLNSKEKSAQNQSQIGSPSVYNRINISSTSQANNRFFQNTKDLQSKINRIKDKLARQYQKSRRTANGKDSNQKNDTQKRSSNKWKYLRVSSSPNRQQLTGSDDHNINQTQAGGIKNICFDIKPSSIQKNKVVERK